MIYHVSVSGNDRAAGTADAPFRTINRAAAQAMPGDTVLVHEGTYREWVDPCRGGWNEAMRITYAAAEGEHVVIKGSEIVSGWEKVEGTVWKTVVDHAVFGDFNPFAETVDGDWRTYPKTHDVHLGDVYIDGFSLCEAASMEELMTAPGRTKGQDHSLGGRYFDQPLPEPWRTKYLWLAEVGEDATVLWCNFQEKDPQNSLVEINVRPCCFYPKVDGINYITVRGFEMCQCASIWAPPSGDQPAMLGPHWSRGWIIEDNHLHDAKCNAISLGKDAATGDNAYTKHGIKSGYYNQLEAVFRGLARGWNKDTVGSHLVRNNIIHDCGQTGIVGHMGCAFSRIEHNEIYRIAVKQEFWGHEMAGIKFHAPIDTVLENNNIHDCLLGIWLDWQAQGTQVSRNILHHNYEDMKIEVTSGPTMVSQNILLSPFALEEDAQGLALLHNLIAGYLWNSSATGRPTPYHFAHSTQVLGAIDAYGGDDRIYHNIFLGAYEQPESAGQFCQMYDKYTTPEEFDRQFAEMPSVAGLDKWKKLKMPVWIEGNAYSGLAKPWRKEEKAIGADGMSAQIEERDGQWILTLDVPESVVSADLAPITTARLGQVRFPEAAYENPDGSPLDLSCDQLGEMRETVIPGPFARLVPGKNTFVVWE